MEAELKLVWIHLIARWSLSHILPSELQQGVHRTTLASHLTHHLNYQSMIILQAKDHGKAGYDHIKDAADAKKDAVKA